jgi:hypothetical protein
VIVMGIITKGRSSPNKAAAQQASRLAAIRAIVDLADDDDENYDVAAAALVVLGASPNEICAATLSSSP